MGHLRLAAGRWYRDGDIAYISQSAHLEFLRGSGNQHAMKRHVPKPHIHRTRGGGQNQPVVAAGRDECSISCKALRVIAPRIDGVLEAADHGKAQRRDARRHEINGAPGQVGHLLQGRTGAFPRRFALVAPVTRHKFTHAVKHRTGRSEPQSGQH